MPFDDERYLEAHVDFGNVMGYFVRLDVEVPPETLTAGFAGPDDDVPHGHLALSPERAEALAAQLVERAKGVREAEARWRRSQQANQDAVTGD